MLSSTDCQVRLVTMSLRCKAQGLRLGLLVLPVRVQSRRAHTIQGVCTNQLERR